MSTAKATYQPKRILVMGTTSGIAEACVRLWAARGDRLFLVARNEQRLTSVAADATVRGASYAATAAADLNDTAAHAALLAQAADSLGGIDIAFLAFGVLGDAEDHSFAAAAPVLHTNLVAAASAVLWLADYFVGRRAGTLAVLSSVAGDRGRKSNYVYGASKAGLSALVDGLRNRIDREGVRVMTIKPGPVRTAMTESVKGSAKFADVQKVAATLVAAIDKGTDVVYVPGMWRVIMAVVRAVPERIFKKLNL